jgi:hypothetical protein
MSDVKPKRVPREPVRDEVSRGEPAPADTGPAAPRTADFPPTVPETPAAAEAVSKVREAIGQIAPRTLAASRNPLTDSAEDLWAAVAEAQAALARGCTAAAVEMTGMTESGIAAASDAAIALFGARTLSEAIEINAGLARRGVDAMIEASARLSAIGVKVFSDASRPILSQFRG